MGKYDDIINLPHHVSKTRNAMSMENRAAQFAPFAALTGYNDAITETARQTDTLNELSDEEKDLLSYKLHYAIEEGSLIDITYFVPDKFKSGGAYRIITGRIKRWYEYDNTLLMEDGTIISIPFVFYVDIKDRNKDYIQII